MNINYSFIEYSFRHSFQRLLRPPATGYRNRETGALTVVGENGYAWSSSSNYAGHNNAGHLNFNSGNVNPLNNNPRAYGFPVRCVQHLRLPFQHNDGVPPRGTPSVRYAGKRYFFLGSEPLSMANVETITNFSSTLLGLETMTPYSPVGRVANDRR